MRRFVDTTAGRAFCHLAAIALVLPTVTLTLAGRAEAQVTQLPSWAITEFKDLKGGATSKYGQVAADAVASELAKTNQYDVVPQESVKRSIETLGLSSPPEGLVNLSRIGQDVRATTIVAGEVIDYKVNAVGGGKQAIVAVRMVAYDVSSGLPVNGALEKGESTIRSGNVTDAALISDAVTQAAALAVRKVQSQQLPSATVLNTGARIALLNQGARSGFKTGDTVILTRGSIQVGTGRIGSLEPDQAEMSYERLIRGVAPGDRARAVFNPPEIPKGVSIFTENDGLRSAGGRRKSSNNATLISALLVVGLVAVLLGSSGNSKSTSATSRVTAQATLDNGQPAVRLNWSPNGFFKGSGTSGNGVARWQIYRNDVSAATPVIVIGNGRGPSVVDTSRGATNNSDEFPLTYFTSPGVGGTQCNQQSPSNAARPATTGVTAGVPYVYSIEAVYVTSSLDVPDGTTGATGTTTGTSATGTTNNGGNTSGNTGTNGTTGTTGTTGSGTQTSSSASTTGNTTTAGTTAGTTSGNITSCYFRSGRSSSGQATALNRPTIISPNNVPLDSSVANTNFTFSSLQGAGSGGVSQISQQYIIEFSDDPTFSQKYTVSIASNVPNQTFFAVNTTGETFNKRGRTGANLRTASPIYYRIGVRNPQDRPGPVKDSASGKRYIYSLNGTFTRSAQPPAQP